MGHHGKVKSLLAYSVKFQPAPAKKCLTNYCIGLMAHKVDWNKLQKVTVLHLPLNSQKKELVLSDYSEHPPDTHLHWLGHDRILTYGTLLDVLW